MLAKDHARKEERHAVRLHGHLNPSDRGATIISFSATGCAFRTTAHLQKGERTELNVILKPNTTVKVSGEIVWTTEDYRIDTFYAYGMKFDKPLSDEEVHSILELDATLSVQNGPLFHP